MRGFSASIIAGTLLALALVGQPAAADDIVLPVPNTPANVYIHIPVSYEGDGIVNSIQPTWFTILGRNTMTRILLRNGQRLPPEIQLGSQVHVDVDQDPYGNLYLNEIERADMPDR